MAMLLLVLVVVDTFLTGLLLGKYNELRKVTVQLGNDMKSMALADGREVLE